MPTAQASEAEGKDACGKESKEFKFDYEGESEDFRTRVREHKKVIGNGHALVQRLYQAYLRERIESQFGPESTIRSIYV